MLATGCRPARSFLINNIFWPLANFLHQTCIVGLLKHLSPYTGCISVWMTLTLSLYGDRKWITECCSLWDVSMALAAWSQWHNSNETDSWYSELNSLQNMHLRFFVFWKYNDAILKWDNPRISLADVSPLHERELKLVVWRLNGF